MPSMMKNIKNNAEIISRTVLMIPVISPVILKPRFSLYFLRPIIPRMMAGIPRNHIKVTRDMTPRTSAIKGTLVSALVVI